MPWLTAMALTKCPNSSYDFYNSCAAGMSIYWWTVRKLPTDVTPFHSHKKTPRVVLRSNGTLRATNPESVTKTPPCVCPCSPPYLANVTDPGPVYPRSFAVRRGEVHQNCGGLGVGFGVSSLHPPHCRRTPRRDRMRSGCGVNVPLQVHDPPGNGQYDGCNVGRH